MKSDLSKALSKMRKAAELAEQSASILGSHEMAEACDQIGDHLRDMANALEDEEAEEE